MVSRPRLLTRPADAEEVESFLFFRPEVKTRADLCAFADKTMAEPGCQWVNFCRVSRYVSKYGGKDGEATVQAILGRRGATQHSVEMI